MQSGAAIARPGAGQRNSAKQCTLWALHAIWCKQVAAYRPVVVLIVAAANAVANTSHDGNCNGPPYKEHRHTQEESFDDSLNHSFQPGPHCDVRLDQFHAFYRDVPPQEAVVKSFL